MYIAVVWQFQYSSIEETLYCCGIAECSTRDNLAGHAHDFGNMGTTNDNCTGTTAAAIFRNSLCRFVLMHIFASYTASYSVGGKLYVTKVFFTVWDLFI